MKLSGRRAIGETPRARGDGGTAILEFTLVSVLLFTIIFGIINFGILLSFKQDVTRAAAEGARAGAIALPSTTWGVTDSRLLATEQATEEAVEGFDRSCDDNLDGAIDTAVEDTDGLVCNVDLHDCDDDVPDTNGYHASDPSANDVNGFANSQQDCVTVELVYDYDAHPIVEPVPLISGFMPDRITAKSVARLNQ
jgi:Flp pilus assembly protein TadG